jgi:hypothetical protein
MVSKQEIKPAGINNWIYMGTTQTQVWLIFVRVIYAVDFLTFNILTNKMH